MTLTPATPLEGASYTDGTVRRLRQEIDSYLSVHQRRHGKNYFINAGLVAIGILLAVGVTAAGFFNYGVIAGVLGLFITLLLGFQNAFYFGEKAEFYRVVATEAENLRSALDYRVRTDADFQEILAAFLTLRKHTATNLPKGKGMEVVREIYSAGAKYGAETGRHV
jgi:hypothetical protein